MDAQRARALTKIRNCRSSKTRAMAAPICVLKNETADIATSIPPPRALRPRWSRSTYVNPYLAIEPAKCPGDGKTDTEDDEGQQGHRSHPSG